MTNRFSKAVIVTLGLGGSVVPVARAQDPAVPIAPAAALPGPVVDADSPMPAPVICAPKRGPIGRCLDRISFRMHDHFIGYPENFDEPPLGWALYQNMGRQKNKADVHNFTLYRSDFVAGTTDLSPAGARRLSFLSSRLDRWPGPVLVEWTPEQPEIGEARRYKVLAALQGAARPVTSEQVVLGPSAYRGMMGPDAGNNHDALIFRDYTAPRSYSVTPTTTADFGGGAR